MIFDDLRSGRGQYTKWTSTELDYLDTLVGFFHKTCTWETLAHRLNLKFHNKRTGSACHHAYIRWAKRNSTPTYYKGRKLRPDSKELRNVQR